MFYIQNHEMICPIINKKNLREVAMQILPDCVLNWWYEIPSNFEEDMVVVATSSDIEPGASLEKIAEVAKVIFISNLHADAAMHKVNAGYINAHWQSGDLLMREGILDARKLNELEPTKFMRERVTTSSMSWNANLDQTGTDYSQSLFFLSMAGYLFKLVRDVYEGKELTGDSVISRALTEYSCWLSVLEGYQIDPTIFKQRHEKFLKNTTRENLAYIAEFAAKAQEIHDRVVNARGLDQVVAKMPLATNSLLYNLDRAVADEKIERVWVSCGCFHTEWCGHKKSDEEVNRLYQHLRDKGISFAVIRGKNHQIDALPGAINSLERAQAIASLMSQGDGGAEQNQAYNQIKGIVEKKGLRWTVQEEFYMMNEGVLPGLDRSFNSGGNLRHKIVYAEAAGLIALERTAYWAQKKLEEAKKPSKAGN